MIERNHATDQAQNSRMLRVVPRFVVLAACLSVFIATAVVLLGWALRNDDLIHFPFSQRYGIMMPFTAMSLLFSAIALWLMPAAEQTGPRLWIARAAACVPALLGIFFTWEYATGVSLGIDRWLFPKVLGPLVHRFPGRPAIASTFSMFGIGTALLCLDAKSRRAQRAIEFLLLTVTFCALARFVGFLYGETATYAPNWKLFGEHILVPMSPGTALCVLALTIGCLFARPERGLVALFLAPGPGGVLARSVLPAAILLPLAFGRLGLVVFRAGLHGTEFPLSLVVSGMILLLLVVIGVNVRTIHRVDIERSRAIDSLADKERLLRAVFDNAGAGIALVDADGRPASTNKALQNLLGYSADELAAMQFVDFTHPDDAATDHDLFLELLSGKRDSYHIEKRYLRKDGTQFWGHLTTSVARRGDHPEFMIGMVEDITERKKAQEAQERLTAILEATPDFVGIADANGCAIYINQAGRELTGTVGKDVSNMSIPDFHTSAGAERAADGTNIAVAAGVWMGESELRGAHGEGIPVSQVILAHKTPGGELKYLSTMMRDITDRKNLEDAQKFLLEASRAFSGSLEKEDILRSIVRLLIPARADCCMVMMLGDDGRIERSVVARADRERNTAIERLRVYHGGKKPNSVVADVVRTVKPVVVPEVTVAWLTQLSRGNRHQQLLSKLKVQSVLMVPMCGRDRVLGVICYAMTHPEKRYSQHDVALAEEMAARAALALDNAGLLAQSRDAIHVRDEVLRIVAHDLRNPLNTVSLGIDLLHEQSSPEELEAWGDRLDVIHRAICQANDLIEDLLDVARIEAGSLTVEARPEDSNALAAEALQLLEPLATQRGITLRAEIPEHLGSIQADRHRVRQVFSNLIGNAIKFSENGADITVRAHRENNSVCFSVLDQGPGIDENDLPHLFDRFWQAQKGKGGAGLGLSIAKAVVNAHGGKIWVDSTPGVGSEFFFTLPLANVEPGNRMAA